jgi:FlaA1/EpsC-like NDP-sugar epimerase
LVQLPRGAKHLLAAATDSALCIITVWLAICFRFESWVILSGYQWLAVALSVLLAIPLLTVFGFYHTVIRYAGMQTVMAALRAIAVYAIVYSAIFTVYGFPLVPRTIGLLQPLLLLVSLAFVRILASQVLGEHIASAKELAAVPAVLIYGAGNSGQQLAASIRASGQSRVVGFLDDNVNLHKAQIAGIPVHAPASIEALVRDYEIQDVLLAMPHLTRTRRNEIITLLGRFEVAVRTLPSLSDLASGKVADSDLREIVIEDLLGRDPVPPVPELLTTNITGKIVLVTGAGGSIGSELCRQIAKLSPKRLILLELSEYALYACNEELEPIATQSGFLLIPILADVQNQTEIHRIFAEQRPQTIYHAAAYKHVPLVESNPVAGLRNNVLGTYNVALAALDQGVQDMVLISTDKAVRPTNIMGASKRLAEIVLQSIAIANREANNPTRFCIVRFGNVLGSSGSVVPKFREQIKNGRVITLTHPEVTRYFMTIPEAAQLVLQAAGLNAEQARLCHVYLLDMGESVRIIDLAKTMIQLCGLRFRDAEHPDGDVAIQITGLRPGEKLFEELLVSGEALPTRHSKIRCTPDMLDEHPHDVLRRIIDFCETVAVSTTITEQLIQFNIGYSPRSTS